MDKKVKIIVATHKEYRMPDGDIYLPVQVGAEGKTSIGYTPDNSGDNISVKNPYYCELTGLYWSWKNLEADYIGLAHYRRHFSMKKESDDPFKSILTEEQVGKLVAEYSVIVPKKRKYYIETLYSHYAHTHYAEHLDITKQIITDMCPDYLNSCEKVYKQRFGYMFNMMIMRRDLFDNYCQWLFGILFELENRIGKTSEELSFFQGRFYGRVSEIIFNVWLDYQIEHSIIKQEQFREIDCIHMEKINWFKKGTAFLLAKFFKNKYRGSF